MENMERLATVGRKTVLITGGCGFLGSKIVQLLIEGGYLVILLKKRSTKIDRLEKVSRSSQLEFIEVEDCDFNAIFNEKKIDAVIHTATKYGRSGESLTDIRYSNYFLPMEILEKAISNGCQAFLNADTFYTRDIGESEAERAYTNSKNDFVHDAEAACKNSTIKFFDLIIEQMYGPNDNPTKFLPRIILLMLRKAESIEFTSGLQKRDFVYVDDVAEAFVRCLDNCEKLNQIENFGIGTGRSINLKEAVQAAQRLTESAVDLRWGFINGRQNEMMDSKADLGNNHKIHWTAKVGLEEGLVKTIRYYNGNNL